ncbi:S41 family peptidase [Vibrio mexicanus]|uniref:S41 family peptidase n=1 Tax=Vibrio mexicanus TaxID=1004326 RepID=UPI00063CBBBB|nr:S41 family peptidase [Vibrio mexicanus]
MRTITRLSTLALLVSANTSFAFELLPISEARDRMQFIELSSEEKQLVADKAKLVIDGFYVNKFHKNEYYGVSPTSDGHLDPIAGVTKIANEAQSMTTHDLHRSLSELFRSQRDLHLAYYLPSRFRDHGFEMPFWLLRVEDENDYFQVRVAQTWNGINLTPGGRNPEVGDILIGYQGLPIGEAMKRLIPKGNGSNPYGGFKNALQFMTYRWGGSNLLPEEDTVRFRFRSAKTGEEFEAEYEWIVYSYSKIGGDIQHSISNMSLPTPETSSTVAIEKGPQSVNYEQYQFNKHVQRKTSKGNQIPLNDNKWYGETFDYHTVQYNGRTYGKLNLYSFSPYDSWLPDFFSIRDILSQQNQHTDGLLIDVSGNYGGYVYYAESMPQLFTPGEANVHSFRMLNSELIQDLSQYQETEWWFSDFQARLNGVIGSQELYSSSLPITPTEIANSYGQVYTKPVALLSDASTYSAGDLFTCAMQDDDAAVIYGIDPKTGAGGATIINYSVLEQHPIGLFSSLPLGIDFSFSFSQAIRFGHHKGLLIEDYGCSVDVDVSPTPEDLTNGYQSMFAKVYEGLSNQAVTKSSFQFADDSAGDYQITLNGDSPELNLLVKNTERIKLSIARYWWEPMEVEATYYTWAYGEEAKPFTLPIPTSVIDANSFVIQVEGQDAGERLCGTLSVKSS